MSTHQVAGRHQPSRHLLSFGKRGSRRLRTALVAVVFIGIAATAALTLLHGHRVYVVHTGSMEPTYMPGDVVIDGPAPTTLHRGEAITFRHSDLTTDVVTHRVADVLPNGLIETKGDANPTKDAWQIRPDQVQGKVVTKVAKLGYLIVFLKQPAGIGSLATAVLTIVLLWGLFFPPETGLKDDKEARRSAHRKPLSALPFRGALTRT